jgi:hypothetical protein
MKQLLLLLPPAGQRIQQLTLAGWQSQVPVLHRVLRLLPLSSSGVAIVNAALPGSFGPEVAQQSPPGSYWFFEVLLTVRHSGRSSQMCVGLATYGFSMHQSCTCLQVQIAGTHLARFGTV